MWRPVTHNLLVLSCGVCLFAASGCTLVRTSVQDALDPQADLPDIKAASVKETAVQQGPPAATDPSVNPAATTNSDPKSGPDVDSCFVEIRALGEKPKRITMSLEDAGYIQQVLEQTGLVKEFKHMHIELSRKLPDGTRHKLDVHYDAKEDQVVSAFDYALHPNDLLVIREDSASSLHDMLKKLAGPLGR